MIHSLRRISLASLLIVGAVFCLALASSDFALCTQGPSCVASVQLANMQINGSTPTFSSASMVAFNETVRVVSFDAAVVFVIVLLSLEIVRPHFFSKLRRRAFAR